MGGGPPDGGVLGPEPPLRTVARSSGAGSCPDPNPGLVAPYLNPAFPNAVTVKFSPLQPGKRKNHVLSFWGGLAFAPGKYRFTLIADASGTNNESNEGNNTTVVIKTVP